MAKEAAWKTMHDVALILFEQGVIPDPAMVSKVVLTVSTDDATTVDVTMFVQPDAVNKAMTETTKRFELIPRKEEDSGEGHRS